MCEESTAQYCTAVELSVLVPSHTHLSHTPSSHTHSSHTHSSHALLTHTRDNRSERQSPHTHTICLSNNTNNASTNKQGGSKGNDNHGHPTSRWSIAAHVCISRCVLQKSPTQVGIFFNGRIGCFVKKEASLRAYPSVPPHVQVVYDC